MEGSPVTRSVSARLTATAPQVALTDCEFRVLAYVQNTSLTAPLDLNACVSSLRVYNPTQIASAVTTLIQEGKLPSSVMPEQVSIATSIRDDGRGHSRDATGGRGGAGGAGRAGGAGGTTISNARRCVFGKGKDSPSQGMPLSIAMMSLLVDMDPHQLPWSFQDETIGWQTFASDVVNLKEFREAGLNPTESTLQKTISLYLKKYGDSDIPYTTGEGGEDDNYNDCLNEMFSLSAQVAEMENALAEKTATT